MTSSSTRRQKSASKLQPGELERLTLLLRHATDGTWAAALYDSTAVRDQVIEVLSDRLAPLLPIHKFIVNVHWENPIVELKRRLNEVWEKRGVVFLCDLTRDKGQEQDKEPIQDKKPEWDKKQLWSNLEMLRETLTRHSYGLVIWLKLEERETAASKAPNFWSQRSGVFDFTIRDEATLAYWADWEQKVQSILLDINNWKPKVQSILPDIHTQSSNALANPPYNIPLDILFDLFGKLTQSRQHQKVPDDILGPMLYQRWLDTYERSGNILADSLPYDDLLNLYSQLAKLHFEAGNYWQAGELAQVEWRRAIEYYDRELSIQRRIGDRENEAITLNSIGWVYLTGGNLDQARTYLTQALALAKQVECNKVVQAAREGLAQLQR